MPRPLLAVALAVATLAAPLSAAALFARDHTSSFYEHREQVRRCGGSATGDVDLRMVIGRDGRLGASSVLRADSPALEGAGRCVLERAREWSFQRSTSGRHVDYRVTYTDGDFRVAEIRPSR